MRNKISPTRLLVALPRSLTTSLLPRNNRWDYSGQLGPQLRHQPRSLAQFLQRRFVQDSGNLSGSAACPQSTYDSKLDSIIESLRRLEQNQNFKKKDLNRVGHLGPMAKLAIVSTYIGMMAASTFFLIGENLNWWKSS
ncbi:hypothetical protein TWF225_003620 [Orbilia oligospora]|nr:hypothetical protein TWF225_003620 [Orbilia oligospora]KAF3266731.1 hypothetical protein TWF217_001510 [Orbilia oligospora]